MNRLPVGTLSGRVPPIGELSDGDCLHMQELGSSPDLRSNELIINYAFDSPLLWDLPKFVSGSLAVAMSRRGLDDSIVGVYSGRSADNHAENLGTYGEWQQFVEQAVPLGYQRPILVTSPFNVMNSYRQGKLFGIDSIVPPDLPGCFDWRSTQLWTKHWALWAVTSHYRLHRLRSAEH